MTISAKVIADSISPDGIRLTTLQLRYMKFIHGEVMTHRVFSRNASSSRAIPVERLIKDVLDDPAMPSHWGANQKGMQADEECDAPVDIPTGWLYDTRFRITNREAWLIARDNAVTMARTFNHAGYHKQIVNRLLEPFCHINVIVTATEWSNFFALRCHKDAQPEMRALAEAMRDAMEKARPRELQAGSWHLPYVMLEEWKDLLGTSKVPEHAFDIGKRLSVARCARVSYLTQEGKAPSVEEDLALYQRLVGSKPLHASPCEHQATPDTLWRYGPEDTVSIIDGKKWEKPHLHGNLHGWIQFRKTLPGECQ